MIRCFFINTVYYSKQNLHISSQLQYCTNVTKKLSCGDQERRILSIKHYLLAKTTHFPSSDCVVSIASVLLYIPALVGLVKAQFLQLRAILSNSNGKIIIRPNTVIQTCFHIGAWMKLTPIPEVPVEPALQRRATLRDRIQNGNFMSYKNERMCLARDVWSK